MCHTRRLGARLWLPVLGILVASLLLPEPVLTAPLDSENPQSTWHTTPASLSKLAEREIAATPVEVCSGGLANQFVDLPSNKIRTRYGHNLIWLHIDAPRQSGYLVLGAMVDVAELCFFDLETGTLRISRSGDSLPVAVRDFRSAAIAFRISDKMTDQELYLKIVQGTAISVDVRLVSDEAFEQQSGLASIIRAMLLGGVFVIVLHNLVVSLISRDIAFAANAACMFSLLVLGIYLTGIGAAYVWGARPWLSNVVNVYSMGSAVIFGGFLFYFFLRDPANSSAKWTRVFLVIPALTVCVLASSLFVANNFVHLAILLLVAATLLLVLGVAAYRARKGEIRAMILLFPLALAMLPGMFLTIAQRVFGAEVPFVGGFLFESTLVLEALLFSLALAYRLRLANDETQQAQAAYLRLEQHSQSNLLNAVDRDRARIASELHDSAGQGLLTIVNGIMKLAQNPELAVPVQAQLAEIGEYSSIIVSDIRRISHDLHPSTLRHLGLVRSIEAMIGHLNSSLEMDIRYDVTLDEALLSDTQKLHVFRILQELVTNVSKHADAGWCDISLSDADGVVSLSLSAQGRGLSNGQHSEVQRSGLGLTIVEQRIRELSGRQRTIFADGQTCVDIAFPVKSSLGAEEVS